MLNSADYQRVAELMRETAAAELLPRFRALTKAEIRQKRSGDFVTVADIASEQRLAAGLAKILPGVPMVGEEAVEKDPGLLDLIARPGEMCWIVDPLDGTKSFVRRTPFFSTQIALMDRGDLVLGVSCAPVYGETMWARAGQGAWLDGERVQAAGTATLEQASLSIGNVRTLTTDARWNALGGLIRDCSRIRGYGDFCHYHLLARGGLDLVIESDVNILDVAALAVIVREAGGVFTDLQGRAPTLETTSVLAGVPAIHALALERLHDIPNG